MSDSSFEPTALPATRIGPLELFVAFSSLALSGFGGVLPVAYHALVERRKWLTPPEFARILALGQVLPGPNICNLSVMVGYRFAGLSGAAAALAGMLAAPFAVVLALGIAWQRYGNVATVRHALLGMSAVAAGLVIATGLKLGRAMPRHWQSFALVLLAFTGVGLLRFPLLAVMAVLGPLGIFLAWREEHAA